MNQKKPPIASAQQHNTTTPRDKNKIERRVFLSSASNGLETEGSSMIASFVQIKILERTLCGYFTRRFSFLIEKVTTSFDGGCHSKDVLLLQHHTAARRDCEMQTVVHGDLGRFSEHGSGSLSPLICNVDRRGRFRHVHRHDTGLALQCARKGIHTLRRPETFVVASA